MKRTMRSDWALRSVVGLGLAALGAIALADGAGGASEVRIEANKVVTTTQGRFPNQNQTVQLARTVSYADLDLASAAGASELKSRVQATAEEICGQLGKLYPATSGPSEVNDRAACIKSAVDNAMGKVQLAIASAQKAKR